MEPYWLETHDVCAIHNEIIIESGGMAGILNEDALESTLFKPRDLYHYAEDVTLSKLAAN